MAIPHRTREDIVAVIRARMTRDELPRITMMFILGIAGGVAFFTSHLWLSAGVQSMALRYAVAALVGYLAFIVMIRVWISLRGADPIDALDVVNLASPPADFPARHSDSMPAFEGGRSGGAGSSSSWGSAASESAGEGVSGALDVDEIWYLVVLAGLAIAGVLAIGYVVYAAPLLLAEVALDAALVSGMYGRLRRDDVRHWAGTLLRRTWIPASTLIATLAAAGYVMQQAAPGAASIGAVMRHLLG